MSNTIPDSVLVSVPPDVRLTYVPYDTGKDGQGYGAQLMTQFLVFTYLRDSASGLTQVWSLHSKNRIVLGEIAFNAGWRKYTFTPASNTMFDSRCLRDIQVVLSLLNNVHQLKLKARKGTPHANTEDSQAEARP